MPTSINAMVPLMNMFGYVNNLRFDEPGPRRPLPCSFDHLRGSAGKTWSAEVQK